MNRLIFILLPLLFFDVSCKKFLDKKPNENDVTVESLDNLQAMLDNSGEMNSSSVSGYAELIADNYFISKTDYDIYASIGSRIIQSEIENYTWNYYALPSDYYWELGYQHSIPFANNVLDELERLQVGSKGDRIKGSALFYRAFGFLNLAQLYCRPWTNQNEDSLGIVLRLSGTVNRDSDRFTVGRAYEQIIKDLKNAADLLPETSVKLTQPSKAAAYAALARTYLSMNDSGNAGKYADLALQIRHELMDYNSLLPVDTLPIERLNKEVIFHSSSPIFAIMNAGVHRIDTFLYDSYDDNDLRKTIFFGRYDDDTNTHFFRGSYNGNELTYSIFDGLATDEMYLIRAESAARENKPDIALSYLNKLLEKRWSNSVAYQPFYSADKTEVIEKILLERRKELVWRGLRWSDIRRLNAMNAGIKLQRKVGNMFFYLEPNALNTIMQIPDAEVLLGGILPNPR
jgi:hypothetical protein